MDLRLRIRNKTQKTKSLKETGSENQSGPKCIGPKAVMEPKTYEPKLNLD